MGTTHGHIKRHALKSRYLQEERRFWIYYPADFQAEKPYPVLYVHDGEDYLTMGRIRTIANEQLQAGNIQPLVMIGIPVEKRYRNAEYEPTGSRHSNYMSFIVEELMPFVEGRDGLKIRPRERAAAGASLGGVVSCQLAWKYPELFQKVISQSGAFYNKATTDALSTSNEKTRYYFMVGTDETAVPTSAGTINILEANRQLRDRMKERGLHLHYEEWKGGHTWGLWQENIPHALTTFWPNEPSLE